MGVFDSFYLLFKSDTTDAQKGIKDLELEVDKLAAKGKKRSDEENLQYTQKKKQLSERQKALKDEQKEADKLGQTYVKVAEALGAVVLGYLGIGSVKGFANALGETQKFQMSLQLLNQWTGISAKSLDAFDSALQSFGGAPGEGLQTLKALHDYFAQLGFPASGLDLIGRLKDLGKEFKQLSIDQAEYRGKSIGLSDNLILFLRNTPTDKLNDLIDLMAKLNGTTDETGRTAKEFSEQWKIATTTTGGYFTEMWDSITEKASSKIQLFNDLIQGQFKKGFFDAISSLLFGETPEHLLNDAKGSSGRPSAGSEASHQPLSRPKQTIDYFVSQGYTPQQATGIAANAQAESNYGADPRTNAGSHSGVFQWSEKRRAEIFAGTGIDVRNASFEEQLKAANWELNNSGLAQGLKQQGNSGDAAAYFSNNFEVPSTTAQGLAAESARRARISIGLGQQALNDASSSPLNSVTSAALGSTSSTNIKIDNITVHSQASDAPGIARDIGNALKSQLRNTISNIDDGVLA